MIGSGQAFLTSRFIVSASANISSNKRQQRRDRHRDPLRVGAADQRPDQQDQAGDRQVDQPRPMNVRAAMRRIEPMLDRSNQPCPPSHARTWAMRRLSSVSGRAKAWISPHLLKMTTAA